MTMPVLKLSGEMWRAEKVWAARAIGGSAVIGAWVDAALFAADRGHPGTLSHDDLAARGVTAEEKDCLVRAGLWLITEEGVEEADHGLLVILPSSLRWVINPADRDYIYARDGFACLACSATEDLSVDHVVPKSQGGAHDRTNFQTLCRPCNSRKGVQTIDYRKEVDCGAA